MFPEPANKRTARQSAAEGLQGQEADFSAVCSWDAAGTARRLPCNWDCSRVRGTHSVQVRDLFPRYCRVLKAHRLPVRDFSPCCSQVAKAHKPQLRDFSPCGSRVRGAIALQVRDFSPCCSQVSEASGSRFPNCLLSAAAGTPRSLLSLPGTAGTGLSLLVFQALLQQEQYCP